MNRQLAKSVVAAFRDDGSSPRARLIQFSERDWMRAEDWLHCSGMALYLLDLLKSHGSNDAIPSSLMCRLEQKHAENRERTADLFREFVEINLAFQRAGLTYANLKGFTLAPRSYPDPTLRYQHDLDFLVSRPDAERCRQLVEKHGYALTAVVGDTWEFQAGRNQVSGLNDLYKRKGRRSIDVHILPRKEEQDSRRLGDRLSRLQLIVWNGFEFPALSECDMFLAQARHILQHLQSEWMRTSWILEFARTIRSHQEEAAFWPECVAAMAAMPQTDVAVATATLLASRLFGVVPPAALADCAENDPPAQVRRWIDLYLDTILYADFPGTKLYLLLKGALKADDPTWRSEKRNRLLPLCLPPRIVSVAPGDGLSVRLRASLAQLRFTWTRVLFHIKEGVRYRIELTRWKRYGVTSSTEIGSHWRPQQAGKSGV
jgi:hypothetical protein